MRNYTKEEWREYINRYRDERRKSARDKLGGKCQECGSEDDLHFDHIDPSTKTTHIADMWTASKDKFEAELAKCQLLCRSCHILKTVANGEVGSRSKGEQSSCHKLSDLQVLEIRERALAGDKLRAIARDYGVSHKLVGLIRDGLHRS